MSRETYVMRGGRLVPKSQAAPLHVRSNAPNVIGDYIPDLRHPSNGRVYDSKSRFRDETRARGLTEVGNETQRDTRRFETGDIKADLARTFSELGG